MAKYELTKFIKTFAQDTAALMGDLVTGNLAPILHWLLSTRILSQAPETIRFSKGQTALHVALQANHWEVASLLLLWCTRLLSLTDDLGRTPLHLLAAAESFSLSLLISMLRRTPVEVLASRDTNGEDAMEVAIRLGHGDFCTILRMFLHDHYHHHHPSLPAQGISRSDDPGAMEASSAVVSGDSQGEATDGEEFTGNGDGHKQVDKPAPSVTEMAEEKKKKKKKKQKGIRKFLRSYPPKLYRKWAHGATAMVRGQGEDRHVGEGGGGDVQGRAAHPDRRHDETNVLLVDRPRHQHDRSTSLIESLSHLRPYEDGDAGSGEGPLTGSSLPSGGSGSGMASV